jgi:hypothetical protein
MLNVTLSRKSILEEVPLWFEQVSLSTLAQSWGARKRKPKCGDVHYQYSGTSYCPIPTIYWDDFIFMHDNGRPHVAGIVQHYFREVEIGQMQWPARSSDLNLIE